MHLKIFFFSGCWNTWRTVVEKSNVCGGVFLLFVMCRSSFSIHQGELRLNSTIVYRLGVRAWNPLPPPSIWSSHAGDKSGAGAEPLLMTVPRENRGSVRGPRPSGVPLTIWKARAHSNPSCSPCSCTDTLIRSSMLNLRYMDTQREDKEITNTKTKTHIKELEKAEDRRW